MHGVLDAYRQGQYRSKLCSTGSAIGLAFLRLECKHVILHITEPRWPRWRYLLDLPGDCPGGWLGISQLLVCSGRCPEHGRLTIVTIAS